MALNTALWSRKAKLTIPSTYIAGSVGGLCVPVTHQAFVTNCPEFLDTDSTYHPLASGADIRFTLDEAGQIEIPFEIESYVPNATPANGRCEIWVRVPSVSAGQAATFWAWWGNAAATAYAVTATYGRNAVWVDYLAVFHVGTRYVALNGTATDSTGNNYVMSSWDSGGASASVDAVVGHQPPFGQCAKGNGFAYGSLNTTVNLGSFLNDDSWFLELYLRCPPTTANLGAILLWTQNAAHSDPQQSELYCAVNNWTGAYNYDATILGNNWGSDMGASKLAELATWTWLTYGRVSGVARSYISDSLFWVMESLTSSTSTTRFVAPLTGDTGNSDWASLAEIRVSRNAPDENRHTTSRNIVKNLGSALVSAAPQAAPYVSQSTVTLTGLVTDTEVRVYLGTPANAASATYLAGQESVTTGSFSFQHSNSGQAAYIQILKQDYENQTLAITLSSSDTSIPVFQRFDRAYFNPA